jgi:hypothetical protein
MHGKPSRRQFLSGVASGAFLPSLAHLSMAGADATLSRSTKSPNGWKMDVTLYDRPRWTSHGWYHFKGDDGSLIVPIQSCDMSKPCGDFIRTVTDDLVMISKDRGKSWAWFRDPSLTAYPWGCYGLPSKTHDGKLVAVNCAAYFLSAEERQEHLKRYGIARYFNPRSEWLYTPWPVPMADEIRKRGIYVFANTDEARDLAFSLNGFVCRTSTDGGKTWTTRPIDGIPFNSDEAGSFRNIIITRKGNWVASVFATPNPERRPVSDAPFGSSKMPIGSYALRSEDQGATWQLVTIGYDASGEHSFDETALLELPSGRLLAMLRHQHWNGNKLVDSYLWSSYSDDEGKIWSSPQSTGMAGFPAHLLLLNSGKLLCTYGHRMDMWGHRAALSSDGGKTWDLEHVKILRDDSLPGWTTYPMSSQLDDGAIFTTYGLVKAPMSAAKRESKRPEDQPYVCAAASIYSEDFIKPLGR